MRKYKVAGYLRLLKADNNYNKESNSITNQKMLIDEFIININLCWSAMITRKAKNKEYYYCSNYIRNKKCTSHSINKNKFNRLVTEDCKINLKNI